MVLPSSHFQALAGRRWVMAVIALDSEDYAILERMAHQLGKISEALERIATALEVRNEEEED
jgi:hypothetical protein